MGHRINEESKRRLLMSYLRVNFDDLVVWLEANNYRYAFVPSMTQQTDDFVTYLEVYTEEAEIATRLKWEVIDEERFNK